MTNLYNLFKKMSDLKKDLRKNKTIKLREAIMGKLYVGNLSYDVTENELNDLFSPKGKVVSVKIISDHQSGRSKGFGFVEMSTKEESEAVI